jgi:hypothetical protein
MLRMGGGGSDANCDDGPGDSGKVPVATLGDECGLAVTQAGEAVHSSTRQGGDCWIGGNLHRVVGQKWCFALLVSVSR